MRGTRFTWLSAAVLLLLGPSAPFAADPNIDLKVVKYDELGKTIKQLKGKVVVVDFWADT